MKLSVHIRKQLADFCLDVDFAIENETLALLGQSGCGKSMTLKCIAGIETPDEGRITINERVVFDSEHNINLPIQERKIGFVFQNYALFPNMSVEENIACGVRDKKQRKEQTETILKTYDLLSIRHQRPSTLSGGQQQRTAFARTMASKPELLLLDEPFSALDRTLKNKMLYDLEELLETYRGLVVYVSHDTEEVYQLADTIGILHEGKLKESGHKKQLFHHPTTMHGARAAGIENITSIQRVSDHEVYAKEWDLYIQTTNTIPQTCMYIGIPTHAIQGCAQCGKTCFPYEILREIDHLHHQKVIIKGKGKGTLIAYQHQLRDQPYACIREEELHFLSE